MRIVGRVCTATSPRCGFLVSFHVYPTANICPRLPAALGAWDGITSERLKRIVRR